MKMMGQEMPRSKRVLEINMEHPVLRNLSTRYTAQADDPFIAKCIMQLYDSAQLIEGEVTSTADYVKRMMDIMEEATK